MAEKPRPVDAHPEGMTLDEALRIHGYTTQPGPYYRHHIVDAAGITVFRGDYLDVTEWLARREGGMRWHSGSTAAGTEYPDA